MLLSDDLASVGILELIHHDDRPTFILETFTTQLAESSVSQIIYRNPALNSLIALDNDLFERWADTIDSKASSWLFDGREWIGTMIRGRWMVVYCKQLHNFGVSESIALLQHGENERALDLPVESVPSKFHDNLARQVSSKITKIPVWPKFETENSTELPQILDWTRNPVNNLSEHEQFVKDFDWASTSVGPITEWPLQLRMLVIAIFPSTNPRIIFWGPEHVMIYNAAAITRLGLDHPRALGRPAYESFTDLWPDFAPLLKPSIFYGNSTKVEKELAFLPRNGINEETWWSFTISPVIGADGYAAGAVDTFIELTATVISQRRREILSKLAEDVSRVSTLKDLWAQFLQSLETRNDDIPFALVYAADDGDCTASTSSWSQPSRSYTLEGSVGIDTGMNSGIPTSFDLLNDSSDMSSMIEACRRACDSRQTIILRRADGTLPKELAVTIPGRGYGDAIQTACIMPIAPGLGFFIVGFNPRRPYNDETFRFAQNIHDVLAKPSAAISQQRFEEMHDSLSTQLRASTLEAARNEEKFTKLAEASPIGISTVTPDGQTLYVNDEHLKLVGIKRVYGQSFLDAGASWRDKIWPEDMKVIQESWKTLVERRASTVNIKYRLKKPWRAVDKATGSEMIGETWLLNKATAELDEVGNVCAIHSWLLDVSHQHYTESLLGRRLEEALETKRQAERYIDMTSHELRNPLSAILQSADGILTILEEDGSASCTNSSILEAAQTIILCAQHQKSVVDDILTLSKLDSSLLVITPDKVQPPNLVAKVLKMYGAELKRAGVEATLHVEDNYTKILQYQDHVMLDPSRLLQVVINLLTNAIKFTQYMDERRITIHLSASRKKPQGASHNLKFIPPREKSHTSPTSLSSDWGEGEDLYLQLTVQDTGRGLTDEEMKQLFQRFSQASPKTYKQYGGSGLGLFISRELTELQGGQIGVSSKGAGKGSTFAFYVRARKCAIQNEQETATPIALNHVWNTPVTGSTVIPRANDNITARPLPSSRIPLSKKRTHSLIANNLQAALLPTLPQSQQLAVLVVEDNVINQKILAQQLKRLGCTVYIANHGLEALSFLQQTSFWNHGPIDPSSPPPTPLLPLSCVLMDLEMPVMDGLSCVREVRKLEHAGALCRHVPVIAVTANARMEQIKVALDAGMDDVVTKPFRIPDLVPQMEGLIARVAGMRV